MSFPWKGSQFSITRPVCELSERRLQPRVMTFLAYGRLFVGGEARLCQIRDISPQGLRIEATKVPPVGERVDIEMPGLSRRSGRIAWCNGEHGGLVFDELQNLQEIFRRPMAGAIQPVRPPRFCLSQFVALDAGDRLLQPEVVDISFGGLKLRGAGELKVGRRGVIYFGELFEDTPGRICWRDGDLSGFRFDFPMHRDDLVSLLAMRG